VRGKKLVVLVGQTRAVAIAVKNTSGRRRWSKLDEWLRGEDMEVRGAGLARGSQT
jgi:exodeoxyribonuclease V alpha subunit